MVQTAYALKPQTYERMLSGLAAIESISGDGVNKNGNTITISQTDVDRGYITRDSFYAKVQLEGPSAESDYTASDARYWFRRIFLDDTTDTIELPQFTEHTEQIDSEDNPYFQWNTATNLAELDTHSRKLPKGTIVQIFRLVNAEGDSKYVFNASPPAYGFPAIVTASQCGKVTFAEVHSVDGALATKSGGVTGTAREFNGNRLTETGTYIWINEVRTNYGAAGVQADADRYQYWFFKPDISDTSSCSSDSSSESSSASSSSNSSSSASSASSSSMSSSSSSSISSSSLSSSSFSSSSASSSSRSSSSGSSSSRSSSSGSSSSGSSSSDSKSSSSMSSSSVSSGSSSSDSSSSRSSESSSSFSSSSDSSSSRSSSSRSSSSISSSSGSSSSVSSSSLSSSATSSSSFSSSSNSSSSKSSESSSSRSSSSRSSSSFSSSSFSSSKSSSSSSKSSSSFSSSSSSRSSAVYTCDDCTGCDPVNFTWSITASCGPFAGGGPCEGMSESGSGTFTCSFGSFDSGASEQLSCNTTTWKFSTDGGPCRYSADITIDSNGCPLAGTYSLYGDGAFTTGSGCSGNVTISY